MLLGITGNMGCGKSTAAKLFEAHNFKRIDVDQIVREHVLSNPEVIEAIRQRHPSVITEDNSIKRPALAQVIFADDKERLWLESIVHPQTHEIWHGMVESAPQENWIVEVPLLFEKNLEKEFDLTLCVSSTLENQLARLEKRGIPPPLAQERISKQLPLDQKIQRSDIVISNDGTRQSLEAQILYIIHTLKTNL